MDRGRTAKPSFDDDASGCCCLENIRRTSRSIWASGTKNVPFASASGALVLIGLFHGKKEPLWVWRLASGRLFPRCRNPSGAQLALTGPDWTQWLLRLPGGAGARQNQARSDQLGICP